MPIGTVVVTIYQIKVLETGVKICMSVQDTFFAKKQSGFCEFAVLRLLTCRKQTTLRAETLRSS